jgi:hypothetical protein
MLEEGQMATLEERVGHLEGRMQDLPQAISNLGNDVARLDAKLSDSVIRLDTKIADGLDRLDAKISDSVARLDDKMSRQFIWLVGMLVTVLAAVVGGLVSR